MTNYNERLDKILDWYDNNRNSAFQHARDIEADSIELDGLLRGVANETKQAITSLIKELVAEARIDPFDFVESCEPDCDEVRHAYHQGQWDMATRIKAKQEEL